MALTKEAAEAGLSAKDLLGVLTGHLKGGGGGSPVQAQGQGQDRSAIPAALEAVKEALRARA